ncbi:MAG: hypothetical protein K0S47_4101 [Herbinix sp.]|jgi:hypothetical protein|nr:hypothetical protein [Herbinix sp.]
MEFNTVNCFEEFCTELRKAGFALGGANGEGIFTLCPYYGEKIKAHTGDKETDPWEWRIRAVRECDDIAYGKFFFNKGGWITKEWFPYFLAVRRKGQSFDDMYDSGVISGMEKRIYELVKENNEISLGDIKNMLDLRKSDASAFEKAITELQMKMLITICNETYKQSRSGKPYGWPVTTFCLVERFFPDEVFTHACEITVDDARDAITKRIQELNPEAKDSNIRKFISIT